MDFLTPWLGRASAPTVAGIGGSHVLCLRLYHSALLINKYICKRKRGSGRRFWIYTFSRDSLEGLLEGSAGVWTSEFALGEDLIGLEVL